MKAAVHIPAPFCADANRRSGDVTAIVDVRCRDTAYVSFKKRRGFLQFQRLFILISTVASTNMHFSV